MKKRIVITVLSILLIFAAFWAVNWIPEEKRAEASTSQCLFNPSIYMLDETYVAYVIYHSTPSTDETCSEEMRCTHTIGTEDGLIFITLRDESRRRLGETIPMLLDTTYTDLCATRWAAIKEYRNGQYYTQFKHVDAPACFLEEQFD